MKFRLDEQTGSSRHLSHGGATIHIGALSVTLKILAADPEKLEAQLESPAEPEEAAAQEAPSGKRKKKKRSDQ